MLRNNLRITLIYISRMPQMSAQELLKIVESKFGTQFRDFIDSSCMGTDTKKKTKAPKDPNREKRPLTPYFIFANEKRNEVKAKHADIKITEISKKLGEMWKSLPDEEKAQYISKSQAGKEATKAVTA